MWKNKDVKRNAVEVTATTPLHAAATFFPKTDYWKPENCREEFS